MKCLMFGMAKGIYFDRAMTPIQYNLLSVLEPAQINIYILKILTSHFNLSFVDI